VEEIEGTEPPLADCRSASEHWRFRPLLSLIVYARSEPGTVLEKTIASITEQAYTRWELCICTDVAAPDWLSRQVTALRGQGFSAELIQDSSLKHALRLAVERTHGAYATLVPQGALLNPRATYAWVEILQRGPADVVYSDWIRQRFPIEMLDRVLPMSALVHDYNQKDSFNMTEAKQVSKAF